MASAASTAPARATKAALARQLGVSRQAVGDLVKRGVLSEDKDGLIDVEMARVALANRVRPSGKTAQALAAPPATPKVPLAEGADPALVQGATDVITSFHVARTLNEAASARINQLKLREMQGELIRVDVVEATWATGLAAAREHLLQLRARLAPMLAAETDPFRVEQLLEAEHHQALQILAGTSTAPRATAE